MGSREPGGENNRRAIIPPVEQPVVDLEPDRSDPRMRLKQNWSFQARERVCLIDCRSMTIMGARLGDESNQVS
jgi:hypothetical protein